MDKLPPIVTDPLHELVQGNGASLKEIESKVTQLQDEVAKVNTTISKVESRTTSSLGAHVSYADALQSSAGNVSSTGIQQEPSRPADLSAHLSSRLNRRDNLIIFGLPEVDSLSALKCSVDELLSFFAGQPIGISDLFRLGRSKKSSSSAPTEGPRPVLLKLSSSWDRRLVVSSVRQLKGFKISNIFIQEDLSPEERKKRRDKFLSRRDVDQSRSSGFPSVDGSNHSDVSAVLVNLPINNNSQS